MQTVENTMLSKNVYIIDTAFYMPQLARTRRIWLYLPPDYSTSKQQYPVLYMHDGQNLFEDWSAFDEEWGIDESLNNVNAQCIVVGIDNGLEKRLNEYTIHNSDRHGNGEGNAYLSFLVHTLKPYIDETYRTLSDRAHTFMAGSSLGGLITFYGALYYPEVFGAVGIFSPSFWIAPGLVEEARKLTEQNKPFAQRFYFYYGEKEGAGMTAHTSAVANLLKTIAPNQVNTIADPEGTHSEKNWRAAFPPFYKWLMQLGKA